MSNIIEKKNILPFQRIFNNISKISNKRNKIVLLRDSFIHNWSKILEIRVERAKSSLSA
jgi:hypothetical protein